MGSPVTVFGIYDNHVQVDTGVAALTADGFRTSDISVLFPEQPVPAAVGGGSLGLLAGIGALAIPGFGALIAAGPIVGALAGAGGSSRSVAAALAVLGVSEYQAARYDNLIREGGILLTVTCEGDSWIRRAVAILRGSDAREVTPALEATLTAQGYSK